MIDFNDIQKKWMKDPQFVEEYEKHRLNFEIAIELTQAREKAKITQKELAKKNEHHSVRSFSYGIRK